MKLIEEFDIIYHFKDDESEIGVYKVKSKYDSFCVVQTNNEYMAITHNIFYGTTELRELHKEVTDEIKQILGE
ncbi:MAG: hypothetical protein J6T10_24435 [Methanobrevibacter sp.]|nr:hypothetical protein [Methanobrevibacter sp.]